jgi:hypothetical protein
MLRIIRSEGTKLGFIGKIYTPCIFTVIEVYGEFTVKDAHGIRCMLGAYNDLRRNRGILGTRDGNRHGKIS